MHDVGSAAWVGVLQRAREMSGNSTVPGQSGYPVNKEMLKRRKQPFNTIRVDGVK